ncbi:MAG: hypothetical protein DRJ42_23020, partial [Deltaproteobacteria bacterium]
PFAADSMLGILAAIIGQDPIPPSELWPDVPPALDDIVLMALSRSVDDRYQSADEMREALEAIDGSLSVELRRSAWFSNVVPIQQTLKAS